MSIRQRMIEADYRAMLALSDARKAENAAARTRVRSNPELGAELLAQAQRRGESTVDWDGYFSEMRVLR